MAYSGSSACSIFLRISAFRASAAGVFGEIAGDAGVEVPAVVIEFPGQPVEVGEGFAFDLHETEDDVHDLDARVVDIVLDLDLLALVAKAAGERVAQARVPEVADVGRLVRVDVRVLDDDLLFLGDEPRPADIPEEAPEIFAPVEEEVDEAGPGDLDLEDAVEPGEEPGRLLGDRPGRLLELFRELEGKGEGQVPHALVRRRSDLELFEGDGIRPRELFVNRFFQTSFEVRHNSPIL